MANIKSRYFFIAALNALYLFLNISLSAADDLETSNRLSGTKLIDKIAAVVNNDVITLIDLNSALKPYVEKVESSDYDGGKKSEILSQLRVDMLNRMVERKLTDQEAKRLKITVSDKEVDSAIERVKESQLMSQEELEKALKDDGLSFSDYREKIREEILRPKLINQSVKSKVVITESDIRNYYQKNNQDFAGKTRYYLRNILIKPDDGSSDAAREEGSLTNTAGEKRKKAENIKKRLDAGEDFKEVAKLESEAPNAKEGGDLGFFDWDTLSDTIKEAVEPLKTGKHTDIILTDQGYQIFYVENIENKNGTTENSTPLDKEVSEAVSKKLYNDIVEKKFNEWLEALKEKSHIKIML